MSELSRVTQLYQSNMATLIALQTQLAKLESQIGSSNTYKDVIKENRELRDKRNQLNQGLIELQIMQGEVHVPLPEDTPHVTGIVFPQKRACEFTQSESEPSPKLDKREITEKPRQQQQRKTEVPKLPTDRPIETNKPIGTERVKPKGTERAKAKGAEKPIEEDIPDISKMDFRIGKVLEVSKHPNADTLYIERIECGDGEGRVRQVVSGLVGKIPVEEIQDRIIVVCCNLKPREMRGVLSEAMVMCASTGDAADTTEFIDPPTGCVPGEVITFDGYPHKPEKQLNPKKKILEKVLAELKTDGEGVANYKGAPFRVGDRGICRAKSLRNTIVK